MHYACTILYAFPKRTASAAFPKHIALARYFVRFLNAIQNAQLVLRFSQTPEPCYMLTLIRVSQRYSPRLYVTTLLWS